VIKVHTEATFEESIVDDLVAHLGWAEGTPDDFDRQFALVPKDLFAFIETTQPELWTDLRKQHRNGLEPSLLDTVVKMLDSRGTLDCLRHGIKFYGKKIDLAYFKPAHGLNPDLEARYAKNRLVVTRQVKFIPDKEDAIDLVLFVNGLPVATVELKNPLTGQRTINAICQYMRDRDSRMKIFEFKRRAIVHFAVDPDTVYMTTRLAGSSTFFLPFNQGTGGAGNAGGAGNPANPEGYRTAYLWEQVWQRDSFLDILGRFMHLVTEEKVENGKKRTKETMIFPRFHQLDSVRRLEATARGEGPGHNYLVQHSAGSGKSNSIAWLAHRLSSLHDATDRKVFDSVIVVTDRRVLDKQLQDTIYQFEHKQGVVARIDQHSSQLAEALASGTPIIITTLQKFPFVTDKIAELPSRNYAVIVDEAHSSQTGEALRTMKEVLSTTSLEEAEKTDEEPDTTYEDEILKVMQSRGPQKNLSFFAFTATPKFRTLEVFGRKREDGKPYPFHLYPMRQAIEENFILDVLKNYTTYKAFYRLVKAIPDDPEVDKRRAAKALARFMSLHPHNIAQKAQVMIEHFRHAVMHRIGGKAKAMVVTASRLHAVRYKITFDKYIKEKGYSDIGVLVAFSGTVRDEVGEFTEVGMNKGISEKGLPAEFDRDGNRFLIVANKYQTGFDQLLLHTMYVDKRLSGVQAVQTLSRLNRTCPGKEDTFVLDFVNDTAEIKQSFQPYYETTTVAESADPQQLYDLQHDLDGRHIYLESEVKAFCKVFFKPKEQQTAHDQAHMNKHLDPAVDRFAALEAPEQEEFRKKLTAFVHLYSFLTQVMGFLDQDLEERYTFGRFLLTKLPRADKDARLDLDGDVQLRYYRLQRTAAQQQIGLDKGADGQLTGPTEVGTGIVKEAKAPLSEIIEILNDRFGTDFTEADRLFFEQVKEEAKADSDVRQKATANTFDNFSLAMRQKISDLMVERMEQNQDIVTKYLDEKDFQDIAFRALVKAIYEDIRRQPGA
jgi:type I restriction enzyme R subunit